METLRGIFPRTEPPPKRDFLKENVIRIKNMQRMRKTKDTEYNNKFSKPIKTRKLSMHDDRTVTQNRSSNSLALCSTKAPIIGNLRKSLSTMSISKECGTQTVDPEADEFFLKDTIIRYPSASTIRSIGTAQHQMTHTCSKGHLLEQEEAPRPPRYKSHFHDRKDEHSERMERHISNLSEFLDKGTISKKQPSSILKSSSSLQKLNKNTLNESQQKEDRHRIGSTHRVKADAVVISDDTDDDDNKIAEVSSKEENKKESPRGKREVIGDDISDAKKQQLKAASEDPDCPEGHVPLSDEERLDSLKIAKKRKKQIY